jgi:hypothetical protein
MTQVGYTAGPLGSVSADHDFAGLVRSRQPEFHPEKPIPFFIRRGYMGPNAPVHKNVFRRFEAIPAGILQEIPV